MTTPSAPATISAASPPLNRSAPFLAWPVSQRDFYRTISVALIPALAWGVILFGSRPLMMILASIAGTTLSYLLIKRVLVKRTFAWEQGKRLMFPHCLLAALVMVSLAHPTWPVWVMACEAVLLPFLLALIGGPGRERIHVAVAAALAVQYIVLPNLPPHMYSGRPDAILARNRLVMGDIRDQGPPLSTLDAWPTSAELAGNDAVPFVPPAAVAADTLDQVAQALPDQNVQANIRIPSPTTRRAERPGALKQADVNRLQGIFDRTFIYRLPPIESFLEGIAPNRIGAASLVALTLAGLYLSYRYILRPRSVLFFLVMYILATALFLFPIDVYQRAGLLALWEALRLFPGQIVTLFHYLLLNSDAAFAGIVILALPGTEPLTARGRRIFLTLAAFGAALLHRLDPSTPAATLALCLLMPAAPVFDRLFTQRSWLNSHATIRRPN